jgi:hypothetical protein
MAEIVNFRRAKKAKARTEEAKQADANRAKFGTPKAERNLAKAKSEKAQREHEQNKLEKE